MMRSVFLALGVLVLVLSCCAAQADTFYEYTGNYYDHVSGPYTASDRVTGFFETTTPLAPNLSFAMITPEAFSYNDGVGTLDSNNATFSSFIFTDADGEITQFFITITGPSYHALQSVHERGIGDYDIPEYDGFTAEGDPAGTYTRLAPTVVTPELPSCALLSTGLLGVAGVARKRLAKG